MADENTHTELPGAFLDTADRKYPYRVDGRVSHALLRQSTEAARKDNNTAAFNRGRTMLEEIE